MTANDRQDSAERYCQPTRSGIRSTWYLSSTTSRGVNLSQHCHPSYRVGCIALCSCSSGFFTKPLSNGLRTTGVFPRFLSAKVSSLLVSGDICAYFSTLKTVQRLRRSKEPSRASKVNTKFQKRGLSLALRISTSDKTNTPSRSTGQPSGKIDSALLSWRSVVTFQTKVTPLSRTFGTWSENKLIRSLVSLRTPRLQCRAPLIAARGRALEGQLKPWTPAPKFPVNLES
ncbi:hypothetical protein CRM22_002421 [Opisthorchis felineus]|uniref:Uncharacterized protein n=1 Tax=Opisthorchis felineus TaxID=147828 RepID=A0A4S2M6K6_OPIFE|nr:hypothetical protein CRM22_002421 [Opisthorchis felineus]